VYNRKKKKTKNGFCFFCFHAPLHFLIPTPPPIQMTAVASALAALTASGADPETLASAIQGASFLDGTPGDARQQLRGKKRRGEGGNSVDRALGWRSSTPSPPPTFSLSPCALVPAARARLRKILADEEAKAAAEAARPAGERSPFVKEVTREKREREREKRLRGGGAPLRVFALVSLSTLHPFFPFPPFSPTTPLNSLPSPPPMRAWPGGRCPNLVGRRSSRTSSTPSMRCVFFFLFFL